MTNPNSTIDIVVCPNENCRQKLRVPTSKGALRVTCPQCRRSFDYSPTHDRKGESAEYIRLIRVLEQMVSEKPDISDLTPSNLRKSLATSEEHTRIIEALGPAVIPSLCDTLYHADPKVRAKSCWALQVLGSKEGLSEEAIFCLVNKIEDPEEEVRECALYSMGVLATKIDLSITFSWLTNVMRGSETNVRKGIIELLGKMRSDRANVLDALYPMVNDPDIDVVESAKSSIVKLGGKVNTPEAGSSQEITYMARLVSSSENETSKKAWTYLEQLPCKEIAIEALMATFRSTDRKSMASKLAEFLSKLGTNACLEPLLEILEYARESPHKWDTEYLAGAACLALLKLEKGISVLRRRISPELMQFVITHGLLNASSQDRLSVVEMLSSEDRQNTIADIISYFRSVEDKDRSSWKVSGALAALGGDAFEPLLEVLRSVKPSEIQPDGSTPREDKGEDGPPSLALVSIPDGIEKLRDTCSTEEYEEILVRAHEYGGASNPELNAALGEIATSKAVGRLVFVLRQDHWETESLKPARQALVKIGKKAHKDLIKELGIWIPTDRKYQTNLRKSVLDVLRESGDEQCIEPVKEVLLLDPLVAEDAHNTIKSISRRCNILYSETAIPQSLPIKKIAKAGDQYIDECFHIDFDEFYDGRDWFNIPEAKSIPDIAKAGRIDEAIDLAKGLRDLYPDFYFSYCWLAILYRKQGNYNEAKNSLAEGLRISKT